MATEKSTTLEGNSLLKGVKTVGNSIKGFLNLSPTTTKTETKTEKVETPKSEKKATEKKYVILTNTSYPMVVSKEQYDEIKKSANTVETEDNETVYCRIVQ